MEHNPESQAYSPERELERLAREMDEIIEREEPAERQELRMFASALINQSGNAAAEAVERQSATAQRPMGIITGSLMVLLVGAGLFLILPPIGATLIFVGLGGAIWGVIVTGVKKRGATQ